MNKTFLILLMVLFSKSVLAQQKATLLDSLVQNQFIPNGFTGNILIVEKGKVIYQKSIGYCNLADSIPMNEEAIFELASVSKQFTAAGVVLLQQKRLLEYDDTISKYIPELADYPTITIRNLLHHTSGLPDYLEEGMDSIFQLDGNSFLTNQDIIDTFSLYLPPLHFSPSSKFEYTNTGYVLLATIIERVAKQDFGIFLKNNIFQPLGMSNTFVYRRRYQPQEVENFAFGYVYSDSLGKDILPDDHPDHNYVIPLDGIQGDGMVNSTVHDLLIWDRALYSNQLFNEEDKTVIFTPATLTDNSYTNYAFGWSVDTFQNTKVLSHAGGWSGYVTYIERHLETDKTIIILQNNFNNYSLGIKEIRTILYDLPIPKKKKWTAIKLASDLLENYTGTYLLNENISMSIFLKHNSLQAQLTGQNAIPIFAAKEDLFFLKVVDAQLVFERNEQGEIIQLILHQEGHKTVMVKK